MKPTIEQEGRFEFLTTIINFLKSIFRDREGKTYPDKEIEKDAKYLFRIQKDVDIWDGINQISEKRGFK